MGETDPMGGETSYFGETFGSQGITSLYPYSRYNGASTNEVDLYVRQNTVFRRNLVENFQKYQNFFILSCADCSIY